MPERRGRSAHQTVTEGLDVSRPSSSRRKSPPPGGGRAGSRQSILGFGQEAAPPSLGGSGAPDGPCNSHNGSCPEFGRSFACGCRFASRSPQSIPSANPPGGLVCVCVRDRDSDPDPMSALRSRGHAKTTLTSYDILPSPVRERRLGSEVIDGGLANCRRELVAICPHGKTPLCADRIASPLRKVPGVYAWFTQLEGSPFTTDRVRSEARGGFVDATLVSGIILQRRGRIPTRALGAPGVVILADCTGRRLGFRGRSAASFSDSIYLAHLPRRSPEIVTSSSLLRRFVQRFRTQVRSPSLAQDS